MIVVASTTAPWKCDGRSEVAWLANAQRLAECSPVELRWFVAIETDARGMGPFTRLLALLADLPHDVWDFHLNDGSERVESGNRLIRICLGRTIAQEYAMRTGASHVLFIDTDITVADDAVARLLEVDRPVVGGAVGIYNLGGPRVSRREHGLEHANIRAHWNTAGFLLVRRDVFCRVAWNYDLDSGNSDDPAFQRNCRDLGFGETWVRHDVHGQHVETPMVPVEERGADLAIVRR